MGLNFNNNKARWSCSGFNLFRKRLGEYIGINLYEMQGFGGNMSWEKYKHEGIYPLLYHSDCDGNLTAEECERIVPQLSKIISEWNEDDYDRRNAEELIRGMKYTIKTKEPLVFK